MAHLKSSTDVLVVGGGPAGLAAALACRKRGMNVTLADLQHPPIDKACGEGVMPYGVTALHRLGVDTTGMQAVPFHGITFIHGKHRAQGEFTCGDGLGVRRTELHHAMVQAAMDAGVGLQWRTFVGRDTSGNLQLNGETVRPRWIIGADGHNSRIRDWAGIHCKTISTRIGLRRHYKMSPWNRFVEVHWGRNMQAYVTPVSSNEICIAVVSRDKLHNFDDAISALPDLAARLAGASHPDKDRGGVSLIRRLSRVASGNTALLGDASGGVDAVTGEGTTLAFCQALSLADALAAENLKSYEAAHARLMRLPIAMSRLLLLMDRNTPLRSASMAVLDATPVLFHTLLQFHLGPMPQILRTPVIPHHQTAS